MSYESEAMRGFGTILQIEIAAVFTNVWEVLSITPGDYSMEPIEKTHMESPNDVKEWMGSLGDAAFPELAELLLDLAVLAEGGAPAEPRAFVQRVQRLLLEAAGPGTEPSRIVVA